MICFVINKKSGNGKAGKVWEVVEKRLKTYDVKYSAVFSRNAEDACKQIRASDHLPLRSIAVIGGDGTIHGILPVLIEMGLPLGVIPAGTGNDLARSLGIPSETDAALDVVLNYSTVELDCIHAHDTYSAIVAGVGLDAEVAYAANRSLWKKWFNALHIGFLSYAFSLLYVLFTYRPVQVKLTVDGTEHAFSDVWLMAVSNLPYFGGGMKISPQSKADDSVLDICIVHNLSRFGLLRAFPKVYKGTHLDHPNVTFLHGSQLHAATSKPASAHGDGEHLGKTPIDIRVCPKKLKVLCTAASNKI